MKKLITFILLTIILPISSKAQNISPLYKDSIQMQWVNEKYDSMTLEEKVGQLFIVAAYSNRDAAHENDILKLIEQENIGGLIFMQDQAAHQIELTNKYQTASKIPLLIGMDAEWGLAMRLKGVERFPWNMTLGALRDNELVYKVGKQIGLQANRVGVQFNFSPSIDVNVNPNNPIIGNRSFGSNPDRVAEKGIAYMNGMKAQNVLSSAKHFPGHGNTDQDSHKTLPLIPDTKADLEKYHVAPFKKMIEAGVQSIMVAHLNVPALEPDPKIPSTLSKKIITDYLKGELQFKGIIITDALNMDGVAKMYPAGDVDYRAFVAGNDILLFSQNVKVGKQKIIDAINKGEISEARLEESVKKILMAKYITGLNNLKFLETANVIEDLNSAENIALTTSIFEKSSTVVKNDSKLLPIKKLNQKIAFVPLEQTDYEPFLTHLQKYTNVDLVNIKTPSEINSLNDYDVIIVGAFLSNETVYKPYKLSENSKAIINALPQDKKSVFSLFTSPYGLNGVDLKKFDAVTVHYQNTKEAQVAAAQTLFGAIGTDATLPVDINANLKEGKGIVTKHIKRLGFTASENVGLGKKNFQK